MYEGTVDELPLWEADVATVVGGSLLIASFYEMSERIDGPVIVVAGAQTTAGGRGAVFADLILDANGDQVGWIRPEAELDELREAAGGLDADSLAALAIRGTEPP